MIISHDIPVSIENDDITTLLLEIFECAVNPEHFAKLTRKMEPWLLDDNHNLQTQKMEVYTATLWESLSKSHIDFDQIKLAQPDKITLNKELKFISGNDIDIINDMYIDDLNRLKSWLKHTAQNGDEQILRVHAKEGQTDYYLSKVDNDQVEIIKISTELNAVAEHLIASSFGISHSEMLVLIGLLKGNKVQDIARNSQKSVETVRSQVKSISTKFGVSRQQDIVGLVHNIQQKSKKDHEAKPNWVPQSKSITLRDGRAMHYRVYGPENGRPILCMHSFSSASMLPKNSKTAFSKYKLKWIVPARAGYGNSSPNLKEGKALVEDHIEDYREVLRCENASNCAILTIGTAGVIGHRFALRYPREVEKVFGLNVFPHVQDRKTAMAFQSGMYRTGALASLYSPYMLRLLTRFVIRRSIMVQSHQQLRDMSGDVSQEIEGEAECFREYTAPNLREILLANAEGAWRDCTYLFLDWREDFEAARRPDTLLMQHYDYPLLDIDAIKEFSLEIGAGFLNIPTHYHRRHLHMSGLSQLISSNWT